MREKIFKSVLSFITGALLAAVILALAGIYPGSENTLLIFDMREQFVSFYSSLKSLFNGGSSLLYTFQGSLGTSYTGMFAYYLASPFSFITLFFEVSDLPDAIWLMDLLKCGMVCGSFSLFMDFRGVKDRLLNLSLSLCYGLSSAVITFFILPMYLDTLIWLPLICIFLEAFLEDTRFKNGIIYSLVLAACMYTHYYSAYMVCVFLAFYAVFILTEMYSDNGSVSEGGEKSKKNVAVKRYLLFVLYSLLGAALAIPLLKTVIQELASGKVNDRGVYSDGSFIVTNPLELMKQFICGHYGYLYSEGAPYIYFTVISLVFAFIALYKGRKNRRLTIVSVSVIVLFLFSFMFRPLYRVWHMFRDPVAYPHRFSFLFVFFMLVLAGKGMNETVKKGYHKVVIILVTTILLVFNGMRITKMELSTLPGATRSDYGIFIDTTADLIDAAKEDSASVNGSLASFCRINKDYEFSSNDPMLLSFNGMDYFSSSYDPGMLDLYKNLGFLQYHYKACDAGDTIFTAMMLGTDYYIHQGPAEYGYEMITSNGFATLSKNPYSLGCGYMAAPDTCTFGSDPLENQNKLLDSALGFESGLLSPIDYDKRTENFLIPYESKDEFGDLLPTKLIKNTIEFTAPAGKNIYLNFEILNEYDLDYDTKANSKVVYVCMDDVVIGSFAGFQKSYNIYVGNFDEDRRCVITVEGSDMNRKPLVYAMDTDILQKSFDVLSECSFNAGEIGPGKIAGSVNVTHPGRNTLVFTVSYSDRFEVRVDGRPAVTKAYAGGLLSVPDLEMGEHEVSVRYI